MFKFKSRFRHKFRKNATNFLQALISFSKQESYLIENYCANFSYKEILAIFLLEDLNVRIRENKIPNLVKINPDLISYLKEINYIVKFL